MRGSRAVAVDGSALRQASDAPLPFRQRKVTLVRLGADHRVEQAYTVGDKQELIRRIGPDDYRTDDFRVNDLGAARDALSRGAALLGAEQAKVVRSRGRPAARFIAMRW